MLEPLTDHESGCSQGLPVGIDSKTYRRTRTEKLACLLRSSKLFLFALSLQCPTLGPYKRTANKQAQRHHPRTFQSNKPCLHPFTSSEDLPRHITTANMDDGDSKTLKMTYLDREQGTSSLLGAVLLQVFALEELKAKKTLLKQLKA